MPFLEFEAQSQRWLPRAVKKQTAGRGGGSASESGVAGGVQEPRGAERASGRGTAAGDPGLGPAPERRGPDRRPLPGRRQPRAQAHAVPSQHARGDLLCGDGKCNTTVFRNLFLKLHN